MIVLSMLLIVGAIGYHTGKWEQRRECERRHLVRPRPFDWERDA